MTDRVRSIHVVLDQDYRDDDAQAILDAIGMVKGVESAQFGDVVSLEQHLARRIARSELRANILDTLTDMVCGCDERPDGSRICAMEASAAWSRVQGLDFNHFDTVDLSGSPPTPPAGVSCRYSMHVPLHVGFPDFYSESDRPMTFDCGVGPLGNAP